MFSPDGLDHETLKHIEQFVRRHIRLKRAMLEKWLAVRAYSMQLPLADPQSPGS
jgi:hypothetical protein